mmetsp:Transcript_6142/g.14255  ORF Transcript_6142/g.14255 Transcript_6142/m.14255 type:complete len:788 (+) Transcript_6142:66-2429(+)
MGCGATTQKKYKPLEAKQESDGNKSKQEFKQDNAEFMENMRFLLQVPLLKRLPNDQHPLLAEACEKVAFSSGEAIFKQGEAGSEFFLIRQGEASVNILKDGVDSKIATLKGGDYFGEQALMGDEPRGATVIAETKLDCLKITRAKFEKLGLNEKLNFVNRNRNAVGGGNKRTMETKDPSPKTPEERNLIAESLKANENLSAMVGMDNDKVSAMIDCAWKETVPAGTIVIQEGDIVADYFYIVQEGKFSVSVEDPNRPGQKVVVETVRPGGSFGELALLYLVPRAATVIATEAGVVWVIDRANFKNILMKSSAAQLEIYVKLLNTVEVLTPLLAEEKKTLAQALVEMHFIQNEVILRQGDPGSTFYILYEGEVVVIKDGQEKSRLKADGIGSNPQIFGERALLNNEPRAATVSVTSRTAKVLALDRDSFNMLLGPLQDILDSAKQGTRGHAHKAGAAKNGVWQTQKIPKEDLKKIGLLGCGGFGTVELWEHKQTGDSYALKALSKGFITKTGMQDAVMNEKNILMMTNSDFLIKLYATYNSAQYLYFLLEPALGGELYATYTRRGLHGSEKHARYYVAGVVYAFEHLHERRIIYRDLKPENLLFTAKGYIKLTDMGLAKFVVGKTFTTCGTPDYFAPEVIQSTGHSSAVDWWTLGILQFELLTGHPPFESPSPMQIYSKVLRGVERLVFPPACHGHAEQLVRALLQKDPSKRLPCRPGGVENIKKDLWYKTANFDWEAMFAMKLSPPYKPTVRSKTDIANFSARREDMPRPVEYKDDGSGWDADFATA